MTGMLIATLVFFAAFVQSLSGFGFAVLIMPLVTLMLGLRTAAPLVAAIALTVYAINVLRFRHAINRGEVLRLAAASALGIPVGIWILSSLDEGLVQQVLGLMLITFALYNLVRPAGQRVLSRYWVYPSGFLAGCLGGAYNTPGPPAIVYGTLRRWSRDEFRAALQTLFLINATLVVASHFLARHMTVQILDLYLYALPALGLGIFLASRVDRKVNRYHFRILVNIMVLLLGGALLLRVG
ncbi:MAG: sulfite exporter TauE/SafE family protein [Anaerolineae bacterium]|jgi:uncharacterized membrane protein YfcA